MQAVRHGSANVTIAQNPDRLSTYLLHVEPDRCHLVANHPPEILREIQNRRQHKLLFAHSKLLSGLGRCRPVSDDWEGEASL